MPFGELNAPITAEGLRVDTEPFDFPQGHEPFDKLTAVEMQVEWRRSLSCDLKIGVCLRPELSPRVGRQSINLLMGSDTAPSPSLSVDELSARAAAYF